MEATKQLENEIKRNTGKRTTTELVERTFSPELVLGICSPVGSNSKSVVEVLRQVLEDSYGYTVKTIRLSGFIEKEMSSPPGEGVRRYLDLIEAGNDLRDKYGNTILAEFAIQEIAKHREGNWVELKVEKTDLKPSAGRVVFIIDSIKNIEEYEILKMVYGNLFYSIGVFSNIAQRVKNLSEEMEDTEVYELINRDTGEEIKNGQKVEKTFTESDYFLRVASDLAEHIRDKVSRFLRLVLGDGVVTPFKEETAMYHAFAAAGNSACLSRQVGAAVTNIKGEILSVGWNDVPKFGGSVYTTESQEDHRCYGIREGKCYNDDEKGKIVNQLFDELNKQSLIAIGKQEQVKEVLAKSRIKALIEFSRAVHAEMLAIIQASQSGRSEIIGGVLYCTTYPCHNCARHIIAAGITKVYFIEPYRKSQALHLHSDALTEIESENDKVQVLMYEGVSPKKFQEMYKMIEGSRKIDGKLARVKKGSLKPKNKISLESIPKLEGLIVEHLKSKYVKE